MARRLSLKCEINESQPMNTIIRTFVATIALLGLNTQTHADDEAWAAVGGFIAGVITGSAIEHNHNVHTGVTIAVGNTCSIHHRSGCSICYAPRRGYWTVRQVRVWVPGCWDVTINHCGDRVRVWRPGRYENHPKRVWVAYDGRRYDRPHRDYGRDYGHDRHDRRDYDRHDGRRHDDRRRDGGRDHDRDRGRRG